MSIETYPSTAAAFDEWVRLEENSDRIFEFIAGKVVEVPSNAYVSKIASIINGFIFVYLMNNKIGHLTGENGGYRVSGERYAPDVAFISFTRAPELDPNTYHPDPPELAVEVISDENSSQEQVNLRIKLQNYMAAGVVVWVVRPVAKTVEVYRPGQKAEILGKDGVLRVEDILPGFQLPVGQIFDW